MRKWVFIILGGLGLLVVVLMARAVQHSVVAQARPIVPTPTGETTSITAEGRIMPTKQARLSFKQSGVINSVAVQVGQQVEAGTVLATVDPAAAELEVRLAEDGLRAAKAALEQLTQPPRAEELANLRAALAAAEVRLAQTRAGIPPDETAARAQLESAQVRLRELENRQERPAEVAIAESQLAAARVKLEQVQSGARQEDLVAAEAQLRQAKARLEIAQTAAKGGDVGAAQAQLASAQARLDQLRSGGRKEDLVAAQAAVDSAKAKLNQLTQGLPRTEDVHAAELEVERARTALDGAVAERNAAAARRPPLSRPELEQLDASVRAAQLGVEVAQNALQRARAGATDWDIRQAQLAVDQAQTNVQKLKSPSPAEIGEAVASVEQARANLDKVAQAVRSELETALAGVDQAQATLDKLRSPSEHDLAAAQEAVRQAEAQLEKARGATNSDLAAARAAADQARANLDRTMATKPLDVQVAQRAVEQARAQLQLKQAGPTPADIESAQAKVAQAETSLEQARRHLAEVSLVAPFSGTVTQVNARQGEQTGPNAVAVVLADLSGFFVETRDLDELAAARVEMGQPVRVTINALERTLEGTVTSISPQATVTEAGDTYYVTTIGLTKPDPGLRWGQTVKVEFGTR